MHHSLFRRELLRGMNANALVVRRRDAHRNVQRREGLLAGVWCVQTARETAVEKLVAEDAQDFLKRLGVDVAERAENVVLLEVGSSPKGFRIVVGEGRIEVHGADASALWAGWVSVEHALRRGETLPLGETVREPAWEVQIAPPSWGANYAVPDFSAEYLGDEVFRSLAHQGVNGMLIYGDLLVYATETRLAELHHPEAAKHLQMLKEATERAAVYGIQFYWCVVGPKLRADHEVFKRKPEVRGSKLAWGQHDLHCLCSSNEDALAFHAEAVGNVYKHAPLLRGTILIIGGESYYHCFMRAADAAIGETNCAQCKGKVAEDVIAKLLKVTADSVQKVNPKTRVMAWPYSAQFFWAKEPTEMAMIDRLPRNVTFLSEVDKDEVIQKEGYQKLIWDYTVEAEKASARITKQVQRCHYQAKRVFVKCETSHGVELLHMPYVPGITRNARMWQSLRELKPDGVLQRWGFIGMFDSVAERVAFKARWDSAFEGEQAALETAREAVGEHAEKVLAGWKKFDEALGHLPVMTTGGYYIGPAFMGPAHPLPVWEGEMPEVFRANLFYLAEGEYSFSKQRVAAKDDLTLHALAQLGNDPPVEIVEREFAMAMKLAREGYEILRGLGAIEDEEVREQQAMGEYLYRTLRATTNTIRFLREREGKKDAAQMKEIAAEELENARGAAEMYERTPWLNHALRLDVMCNDSVAMTREKIRLLEKYVR